LNIAEEEKTQTDTNLYAVFTDIKAVAFGNSSHSF